jgi:hypothetical protein
LDIFTEKIVQYAGMLRSEKTWRCSDADRSA